MAGGAVVAPHDSEERFAGLGVTVIRAAGRFADPRTLEAGGQRIRARRFVLATGARPVAPPIPGLAASGYLTNETLFDLTEAPGHLIVIGGGAIGIEMAQAHRRLGVKTTVIEQGRILAREEPEAAAVLRARLAAEGVEVVEDMRVAAVRRDGAATVVVCADGSERRGTHLLLAAGRAPDGAELGLEAAGIAAGARAHPGRDAGGAACGRDDRGMVPRDRTRPRPRRARRHGVPVSDAGRDRQARGGQPFRAAAVLRPHAPAGRADPAPGAMSGARRARTQGP